MTTKQRCMYTFFCPYHTTLFLDDSYCITKEYQSPILEQKFVFSAPVGANFVDFYPSHIKNLFHLSVPVVVLAFNPADCKLGTVSLLSLSHTVHVCRHSHTHTQYTQTCNTVAFLSLVLHRPKHRALQ